MGMHWLAERAGEANPPLQTVVPCYLSIVEQEVWEPLGLYLYGIGIHLQFSASRETLPRNPADDPTAKMRFPGEAARQQHEN